MYPSSRVHTRPKPSGFFRATFGGEVKPAVPCRRFAACKRSLNETKLTFRQNYLPTFSPTVPPFAARISRAIRTWRHLAAEVGTSKKSRGGQGLHNKPIGCGASGAYALGPDYEEDTCLYQCSFVVDYFQCSLNTDFFFFFKCICSGHLLLCHASLFGSYFLQ
jgi:hypothetical protein